MTEAVVTTWKAQTCDTAQRSVSPLSDMRGAARCSSHPHGPATLDGDSSHLSLRLRDSVTLVTLVA